MTEKHDEFEAVVQSIEEELAVAELEKRARHALMVSEVAGLVYKRARRAGVPRDLAWAMSEDYWNSEMIPVEVMEAGNSAGE